MCTTIAGCRATTRCWWRSASSCALNDGSPRAEQSDAFAAKLLADRSRFMEELSKVIAPPEEKR